MSFGFGSSACATNTDGKFCNIIFPTSVAFSEGWGVTAFMKYSGEFGSLEALVSGIAHISIPTMPLSKVNVCAREHFVTPINSDAIMISVISNFKIFLSSKFCHASRSPDRNFFIPPMIPLSASLHWTHAIQLPHNIHRKLSLNGSYATN